MLQKKSHGQVFAYKEYLEMYVAKVSHSLTLINTVGFFDKFSSIRSKACRLLYYLCGGSVQISVPEVVGLRPYLGPYPLLSLLQGLDLAGLCITLMCLEIM